MERIRQYLGEVGGTLFTNWFATVLVTLLPAFYDIRWRGLQNYRASPFTLITINHKRDLDILIIAPVLHLRHTLFRNGLRLHFVAREDLFDPGFLTVHFPSFPWPAGRLCHRINIAPIMRAFRAHPIAHLTHKRLGPLLRDVIRSGTDVRLGEAVTSDQLAEFADRLGNGEKSRLADRTLSEFIGYEYRYLLDEPTDTGILQAGLARRARTQALRRIESQLQTIAEILGEGGICMLAPEGHLSPDGRFWPVKSGLYRLLSATGTAVTVLPISTSYDFMTRRRMRIYVDVGEEIDIPRGIIRLELERKVQHRIVRLGRVTMGQLGSEYFLFRLGTGEDEIDREQLARAISARVLTLRGAGLNLDERLCQEVSLRKRLDDFIKYCLKQGILFKKDNDHLVINQNRILRARGSNYRENPVQYSYNELRSLLEHAGA